MPRRRQNKQSKGTRVQKSGDNVSATVVSFPYHEYPIRLTQTTSGTGGFTSTGAGSASFTAAQSFVIDPFNIGGRLNYIAGCFLEWRLRNLIIKYSPSGLSSSGVEEVVNGGTTTPSYAPRPFAIMLFDDPALVFSTYTAMLLSGGKSTNTTRSLTLGPYSSGGLSKWRFTSTVAANAGPPSSIDYRLAAPAKLMMAYFNASSTSAESFGDFIFSGVAEFRSPCSVSLPIGSFLGSLGVVPLQQTRVQLPKPTGPSLDEVKEVSTAVTQSGRGWF